MIRRLITLITSIVLATATPGAPVPNHLTPKDQLLYYPLSKGTCWVYEGGSGAGTFVVTGAEKDQKSGETVVEIARVKPGGKEERYQKLAISRDGVLWLANPSRFDNPVRLLKTPVRAKETWDFRTSGSGIQEGKGTMRVAGVETVEVPAGKFDAVRVDEEFTSLADGKPLDHFKQTYWYAPNVGVVKSTFEGIKTELKSFTPGK